MILNLNRDWELKYTDQETAAAIVPVNRSIFASKEEAEAKAAQILGGNVDERRGGSRWFRIDSLPCDIRMPLIRDGIIKEPLVGLNSYDNEWIEQKAWWFKKVFQADSRLLENEIIEICLESLDIGAEIFINGRHIGHHASAFYPFRKNVAGMLAEGDNTLLIRLTAGAERVAAEDSTRYHAATEEKKRPGRGDRRRVFLRKPQYNFGWDWAARVATCCIGKDVCIEAYRYAAIRGVNVKTELCGSFASSKTAMSAVSTETMTGPAETPGAGMPDKLNARLHLTIEVENFHPVATLDCVVKAGIVLPGIDSIAYSSAADCLLKSGLNYISLVVDVDDAHLWWPNGMGSQPLYEVRISAEIVLSDMGIGLGSAPDMKSADASDNAPKPPQCSIVEYPVFRYGIRTVGIDQSKINNRGERLFAVVINGVRMFCKGADWIPADSIYARITDEKYKRLISEAREANFNMLRIWGGGLYERDIFYDLCDRYGIMLWHDMMFACAEYPEDHRWFMDEVKHELDWQTRKLRNHPSLALWCGNNENQQFYWKRDNKWGKAGYYGAEIYNYITPECVNRNCPQIPYWNSSAYGGIDPNSEAVGDRHHWRDCMMNPEMINRIRPEEYDKTKAKFISEYGYVGPLRKSSVLKYLDGAPFEIQGDVWQHHNNTFEKDTVLAGIKYHYGDCIYADDSNISGSAGKRSHGEAGGIDIDKYLLYAGLCQGIMYSYSLESFRARPECSGGLFWMYNDCWGETGWTIIDYYLTRKISYYFVKRALAHVKFILKEAAAESGIETAVVNMTAINETPEVKIIDVEYGYVSFDGAVRDTCVQRVVLPPHTRKVALTFGQKEYDASKGVYYARALGQDGETGSIPLAVLRKMPYINLDISRADVAVTGIRHIKDINGRSTVISLHSNTYAHAVHFGLPDEVHLSDEYFDMLPGEERKVIISGYSEEDSAAEGVSDYKACAV